MPGGILSISANGSAPGSGTGQGPLAYQWYIGDSGNTMNPIGGATAHSYTTSTLTSTTRFWVRVSNTVGSVDSNTATAVVQNKTYLPLITRG